MLLENGQFSCVLVIGHIVELSAHVHPVWGCVHLIMCITCALKTDNRLLTHDPEHPSAVSFYGDAGGYKSRALC